ncbi:MAG: hypothetical protein ACJAQU_000325 [Loktanella salsilacus]|jgi:hypothetical protein
MTKIHLSLLKAQLNLDHDLDDVLLNHKLATAESWIECYIGTPMPDPMPVVLAEAALQLAAYWFQQREAVSFGVSMQAVPFGIRELLSPFRLAVTGRDTNAA